MITATGWDYIGIIFENGRAILSKDKRPNETFMTDGFGLRNENRLDICQTIFIVRAKEWASQAL